MREFILENEPALRLAFFVGIFFLVAIAEMAAPRRKLTLGRPLRWYANLGIVFISSVLARIVFPIAPIALAALAVDRGWGIFNIIEIPFGVAVIASVVILDLTIYLQHVMVHAVPLFWRLHRMHHADTNIDVTTGARFHPIEILLSVAIKMAVIVLIGAPLLAVLIFEILLNGTAMFNHGNFRLPASLDRALRLFIVTPDMHRVHHSIVVKETNSNFGFNLPWWDHLFGTYRDQPAAGHTDMTIGLSQFRNPGEQHLHRMLLQPFMGSAGQYSINNRNNEQNNDPDHRS